MRSNSSLTKIAACAICSMAAAALAQPKVDLGKREYDSKCAVCHGKDGKGGGPYAEQLKRTLPDLTTMAQRNGGVFPVSRTYETIEGAGKGHGTREMPIWGKEYRSSKYYDDYLRDPEMDRSYFARSRILALTEYIFRLQSAK